MSALDGLIRKVRALRRSGDGGAALEFALVIPAFIALTVGAMFTANLVFTVSSMHYATEAAARCASIQTTVCTSSSVIQSYATTHYAGPSVSPSFVYSTAGCGHTVTGTVTYSLDLGSRTMSVPVSTASCHPRSAAATLLRRHRSQGLVRFAGRAKFRSRSPKRPAIPKHR